MTTAMYGSQMKLSRNKFITWRLCNSLYEQPLFSNVLLITLPRVSIHTITIYIAGILVRLRTVTLTQRQIKVCVLRDCCLQTYLLALSPGFLALQKTFDWEGSGSGADSLVAHERTAHLPLSCPSCAGIDI